MRTYISRLATSSVVLGLISLLLGPASALNGAVALNGAAKYSVLSSAIAVQSPVSFTGNVGVSTGGTLTMTVNNTTIHGEVDYAGSIDHSVSGSWTITGGEFANVAAVTTAKTDAQSLAATIAGLSGTSISNITSSRTLTAGVYMFPKSTWGTTRC
jgi:hypothetical protein